MRASSVFAASASLLSLASARITGVGIPSTVKPGDTFNLVVLAENYIQSVTDVAMVVGYHVGGVPAADSSLGAFVAAFDLMEESNRASNYNESVTLPATAEKGAATFHASLTSLYGAMYNPILVPFNISFTVADKTSTSYVYSHLS